MAPFTAIASGLLLAVKNEKIEIVEKNVEALR